MLPVLFGIFCIILLWKVLIRNTTELPPDYPGRWPIIGHVPILLCDPETFFTKVKTVAKVTSEKGGLLSMYLGPLALYAITDPEDCMTVANKCLEKDQVYNFLKPLLGEGLITANVNKWKRHRKLINPAFNQQVLNSFIGIFNSQSKRLVDLLSSEVGKQIDQEYWLRLNNLETICLTSAGGDYEEYKNFQETYLINMPAFEKFLMRRFQNVLLHLQCFFNLTKMKKDQDEIVRTMKKLSKSLMKNKKLEFQNGNGGRGKCVPFMDLMIELANRTGCFTDEQICEETDNIIAGGHETTAHALTFLWTLLGSHQGVQQKLYDEIVSVIGKCRDIEKDDLPKLVYMDAVLKESLRLYPAVPIIMKYSDKEIKLKNYTIKPNSRFILCLYGMNRHPVWGPDADEFRPERWLDLKTLPDQNSFGSFGLGRRACIGKMYAMMSMKITMAHILLRYKLHGDISKLRIRLDFILRPAGGHKVTIERRE